MLSTKCASSVAASFARACAASLLYRFAPQPFFSRSPSPHSYRLMVMLRPHMFGTDRRQSHLAPGARAHACKSAPNKKAADMTAIDPGAESQPHLAKRRDLRVAVTDRERLVLLSI